MKILVSTKEKQGNRKNDFCFTDDREYVKFGMECDRETLDGHCGCKRSMVGVKTLKATTTFKVAEENITMMEYIKILSDSDKKAGWNSQISEVMKDAEELYRIASIFKLGTILEKRGTKIGVRK